MSREAQRPRVGCVRATRDCERGEGREDDDPPHGAPIGSGPIGLDPAAPVRVMTRLLDHRGPPRPLPGEGDTRVPLATTARSRSRGQSAGGYRTALGVTGDAIDIREFREDDLEAIVEFSLRAWEPVFAAVRNVLGDDIFLRLHPDWRASQAEAVRSSCASDERDVFVAVADGRPVGFVAVALNAFHERMGVIDIIGVDPDYQRREISSRLTEFAIEHMRSRGMDIAVVETGGDPGHAPARAAYQSAGFTLLPIARYFRLLD